MDPIIRQLFVRVHARYSCSPYAADLAAFGRWLLDCGYWPRYAQRLVFRAKRSLESTRPSPGQVWGPDELTRAFSRRRERQAYRYARHTYGRFLQSIGKLAPEAPKPHADVVAVYAHHLKELCGLAADTITGHAWEVGTFLQWGLPDGEAISTLNARRIEQYIEFRAAKLSRRSLCRTIDTLRAFLRYCFDHGLIAQRLDEIERPVSFREELPPRALLWPLIRSFLRSVDRRDRTGWRDFVILHLMAHYGLRPGEITRLRVESIDWRKRTLTVEQTKTHSWLILPLDERTHRLLTQYMRASHSDRSSGTLFVSACAPRRAMTKFSVSQMFRVRARRSGLPLADASAYSLRHSFAMRLFDRGVGIKAIGDLMGHHSVSSTAVYLRLQTEVLRKVALPVPAPRASKGGAS
ncbi:MAG TPA: tyrosine-type recombinase/integrase [Hyphomonas sp.]|nr:tyrosine-type recombinase/integrase [Hyphomonas sp.]